MASTLDDFEIENRLGEGAYSSVYKVIRNSDGQVYALKKVRMMNLSAKERENALNEVRILASINNSNIVSYKEAFMDKESKALCIIMEFADDGDLFQKIIQHQKNMTNFKEDYIWKVFIMIVRGLKTLHDLDIMHRDLKSANVFLNQDGTGMLGDMNVSKIAEKGLSYTQTGTPYYASPEVWRDEPYDGKSDIWSLGCVLYEMIALKPPFRAENMQGLYKKVLRGIYPRISKQYSSEIQTVVKSLLQVSAKKRPNWSEILNNPVVKKKIKELFGDNDEDADTETDTFKNSLLKTIYFPKNKENILNLTDKLPKPSYNQILDVEFDERKNTYRSKSKSPNLTSSQDTKKYHHSTKKRLSSNSPISNKSKSKVRDTSKRSNESKKSEEAISELPSVAKKNLHSVHKTKHVKSVEQLPEVVKSKYISPNKLASVERIASRLQNESIMSKPSANESKCHCIIIIESSYHSKVLNNKNNMHKIISESNIERSKYSRENNILTSIKKENKYKKGIHLSQNIIQDSSKQDLNLGVVGEKVGPNPHKRALKGNSLNMRLPRIGDGVLDAKERILKAQKSIDNVKLPNLSKYKHGKYYLNNSKLGSNKNSNGVRNNYRYIYGKKSTQDIYGSYTQKPIQPHSTSTKASKMNAPQIGKSYLKSTSSASNLQKLKMYQNNIKIKPTEYEKKQRIRKPTLLLGSITESQI